jgi:6-phosphogluconolactonase
MAGPLKVGAFEVGGIAGIRPLDLSRTARQFGLVLLLGSPALLAVSPGSAAAPEQRRSTTSQQKPEKQMVYVGTYTGSKSKGIYLFHLDMASGKLTPAGIAAEVASPSFLALHPNGRFLYAVNEVSDFDAAHSGAASAFAIDRSTGKLTLLNQRSAKGSGPCHLSVDPSGKNILVANYGGGSVAVLPVQPDGRLGEATAFVQHTGSSVNPQRQNEPHAHSINVDADNHFAFAADLGLDKVLIYRFDPSKGTLAPNDPPAAAVAPGAGPRHFVFHPNGRRAYVVNEIDSTVTAFEYDPKAGALKTLQTLSTLPQGVQGNNSTAEIVVHPSGKFLYASNRGHDSIAVFTIDDGSGRLTVAGHQPTGGKTPRNFNVDPTGTFLLAANQDSDSIAVFRINGDTGALTPTGDTVEAPTPVCIKFLPMDR